jgi:hypothetical protein
MATVSRFARVLFSITSCVMLVIEIGLELPVIHISVVVERNFHRKERLACQPLCSHIGNQLGNM